jgi:hypothetical protein
MVFCRVPYGERGRKSVSHRCYQIGTPEVMSSSNLDGDNPTFSFGSFQAA